MCKYCQRRPPPLPYIVLCLNKTPHIYIQLYSPERTMINGIVLLRVSILWIMQINLVHSRHNNTSAYNIQLHILSYFGIFIYIELCNKHECRARERLFHCNALTSCSTQYNRDLHTIKPICLFVMIFRYFFLSYTGGLYSHYMVLNTFMFIYFDFTNIDIISAMRNSNKQQTHLKSNEEHTFIIIMNMVSSTSIQLTIHMYGLWNEHIHIQLSFSIRRTYLYILPILYEIFVFQVVVFLGIVRACKTIAWGPTYCNSTAQNKHRKMYLKEISAYLYVCNS